MADRYAILPAGVTSLWSQTSTWSATSGGATGASVPTSADNVFVDADSVAGAGAVLSVDVIAYCKDMDWTGATNNPILKLSPGLILSIYGNAVFSGMSFGWNSWGGYIDFRGTTSTTIDTNEITFGNIQVRVIKTNSGELTVLDSITTSVLHISSGIFTSNNKSITTTDTTHGFYIVSTSTKTLNLGSSIITCAIWRNDGSNLTLNEGTSTINLSGDFVGGGETYYDVTVSGAGAALTITGSNTFNTFNVDASQAAKTITTTDGTTQRCNKFTRDSGTNIITLNGTGAAGYSWVNTWGIVYPLDYLNIARCAATTSNTWYAGTHSTDSGNNTGWIFTAPPKPKANTFKMMLMGRV